MRSIVPAWVALAFVPWVAVAQTPVKPVTPPPAPPTQPVYRGFTPGISYRAFVERAQALSDSDVLRCQTSPRTAQVMECGVVIRDPKDAARFYLSAHFIDGNADVVAFYDSAGFGDRRGVALLDRTKKELERLFERWPVEGAPKGDFDAVHHVSGLADDGERKVAFLLPGHASDGLDQGAGRGPLQAVEHLLEKVLIPV